MNESQVQRYAIDLTDNLHVSQLSSLVCNNHGLKTAREPNIPYQNKASEVEYIRATRHKQYCTPSPFPPVV
jgi:hypothetical protein